MIQFLKILQTKLDLRISKTVFVTPKFLLLAKKKIQLRKQLSSILNRKKSQGKLNLKIRELCTFFLIVDCRQKLVLLLEK